MKDLKEYSTIELLMELDRRRTKVEHQTLVKTIPLSLERYKTRIVWMYSYLTDGRSVYALTVPITLKGSRLYITLTNGTGRIVPLITLGTPRNNYENSD